MTAVERRFLAGFREADTNSPGLIQEDDGTIWLVAPNGTRTQLPGGGGSAVQVGSGSPVGSVIPSGIGAQYLDSDTDTLYVATGVTSADWAATSGGSSPLTAVTELDAAQILDLDSTPVELIPAQGAGVAIWPLSWFVQYTFGTLPYPDVNLAALWNGDDNVNVPIHEVSLTGPDDLVSVDSTAISTAVLSNVDNQGVSLLAEDSMVSGPIASATLATGGSGYAPGDTGTISGPSFSDATYEVDTVDGGGAVVTFHITNPGSAYEVANNLNTSVNTGGGDGAFQVNVTAVTPGDGTVKITCLYRLLTL